MALTERDIIICGHGSGTPSTKIMEEYLEERYNKRMSNGLRKGVLCVRRLKTMTDVKRQEFHDTYEIILGRNKYNQDLREYVYNKHKSGNYYSDCSSSGCATYAMIGLSCPLYNTVGIMDSKLFEDVPVKISKGHILNPEVLKVADAILFAGNTSRPESQYCGHVEFVYEIADELVEEDFDLDETEVEPYIGKITATKLNVRQGPDTKYNINTVIDGGTYVYIAHEDSGWGFMGDGWISLKYVENKGTIVKGKVTAGNLNVRTQPVDGDVKKIIKKNTVVKINKINETGTWGYDTKTKGWVSLKYIKF